MQRLNPKYIRIALIAVSILIVVLLIGGFVAYSKREVMLQKVIAKVKAKAKKDHNLDVKIEGEHFTGLATVAFDAITIVPQGRDSLLKINNFVVGVKLFPLIFGNVKLAEVDMQDGWLNLTDLKGVKNFDFLFRKKKDSTATKSKVDLGEVADNLIKQVLYKIPDNLDMKSFRTIYTNDSSKVTIGVTALIKDGRLTSNIKVNNSDTIWHFAGTMHPSDKNIDISLFADKGKITLPFVEKRFKARVSFDTITTKLNKVDNGGGETKIYSTLSARNLVVNHAALSTTDIVIPSGAIEANIFVGPNYVSVDSSSVIRLKNMTANPYIKYTLNPVKIYEMKVNTGWQNAQDLFDCFPGGTFETLQGIKVVGKLNYKLNFYLDASNPKDVQFDSRLDKDGFKVVGYGKTDFSRLNKPFIYIPYEKGKPMPARDISPKNPNYTPIDQIAPDLRNAVLTAEDPTFYRHNGFVEEAFRKSLATDYIEKKFKRGGSTISMQLVKNAFLSRNKTISRKMEEMLIVWLLENNRIMTKSRMLEVYFNIIEWGRNVYGIGEASRYYFGKTPAELSLGESIYLASIVPKPKSGLYAFLPDGSLNPRLGYYFNLIGNLMEGHGLTAHRDSSYYGMYSVQLKESLRRQIHPDDSANVGRLLRPGTDDEDDDEGPVLINPAAPPQQDAEPEKKPGLFKRILSVFKKDTTDDPKVDTAGKTPKQIRQEKRELKRLQKEREKALKEKGQL
ncbi:transglycosylase domain-containing protein [Mucilaginibacter myungsuensis]|uniref:Transglycosylase domain-containing protein n=1 Tax=Mucilaginibacter myungsuensis TaxID=649104 RepID=A0A929KVG3_9SPHI|nr:biosynthetic peptidoglycan transglycosylase [Mucilaginibacter myungsuensis]MBE9661195.1 transglycosylase domain-containing protein [Mucilaginibacter myungsuensis]MDN3597340.1 biosynthetic peptidoglycan transglycosylase [Mucilaginibacter myungsuensis]